ncbi:MAG TPA: membrane protein insertion efficiency factor YidD [Proteobacteria bacterium]|nr:membrane protein insertion efficiency factor YidD [Pseudomonadota bacterium]
MRRIAILIIKLYQRVLGPILGGRCRFQPSCSQYAIGCFEKHGFFKAVVLVAWRIFRCQPLFKGGYDPVPEPKGKDRWIATR